MNRVGRTVIESAGWGLGVGVACLIMCGAEVWAAAVKAEFDGIDEELNANVVATADVAGQKRSDLTDAQIKRLYRRAPGQIAAALRPFGYYRPKIKSQLDPGPKTWRATFTIDSGPPLRLREVDVQLRGAGTGDVVLDSLVRAFPLKSGDRLQHALYDGAKLTLVRTMASRGYLDGRFDVAQIQVDTVAYSAAIVLHLDTGPRYLFGPVTIHQDIVDTLLLVGRIPFKQGDTLDLSKVRLLQQNLTEAPYFGRAEVELKPEEAVGLEVPVDVTVTARKTQRYEIGLGYGTDTGIRGRLEARFRRLNRKGHNATLRLDASQIERSLSAQYQVPPEYPRTATWTITASAGDFSPNWSKTRRLTLGVGRSQSLFGGRGLASLSAEGDAFEIAGRKDSSVLLMPGYDWTRIHTDNVMYSTSGRLINLYLFGAHDAVLSTTSFLQSGARLKLVQALFGDVRILGRGEVGYTWTDGFENLPPTVRFVTGGAQTVRGYEYQTLGPRDAGGQLVGGPALIVGSVELDYMLLKKAGRWGLAAFIDAGNALRSFETITLEVGTGMGIRWLSPVGILRLDWGWGISEPGSPLRFHFSMGPDL